MQIIDWSKLEETQRQRALARPAQRDAAGVSAQAGEVIEAVRMRGDAALRELTLRFDKVDLDALEVGSAELHAAQACLGSAQIEAIDTAIANVRAFHAAQQSAPLRTEILPGVRCERIVRPLQSVGLYVPAGSAPLPSTAIMLAVYAVIIAVSFELFFIRFLQVQMPYGLTRLF